MSPVVPTYQRQARTEQLPGARLSPGAPQGAFQAPDLSGVAQVTGQLGALLEREKQHADQIHVNGADAQLYDLSSQLESAALQRRGMDAQGVVHAASADFQKKKAEIEQGLTSDRQREAFQQRAAQHWSSLNRTLERHADREAKQYDAESTTAILDGAANEALRNVENPDLVAHAIDKQRAAFKDFLSRNGVRGPLADSKIAERVSQTHAQVIAHLLSLDQDRNAAAYFKAYKSELVGGDLIQAEKNVTAGSTLGEAQRQADTILSTATTLTEAKKLAKEISEPEVRKEAESMIRREFLDRDAAVRQEQAATFQKASAILESTGNFHKIPLTLRQKMTPEENSALQRREDQMRHPKRETDIALYTTLMTMAGLNAATRADFEQVNLAQFHTQLDEDDFKSLVSLQLRMREETKRGDKKDAIDRGDLDLKDVPDRALPSDIRLNIPQHWADSAATNPTYLKFLRHMRVGTPGTPPADSGDINLGKP